MVFERKHDRLKSPDFRRFGAGVFQGFFEHASRRVRIGSEAWDMAQRGVLRSRRMVDRAAVIVVAVGGPCTRVQRIGARMTGPCPARVVGHVRGAHRYGF
ncbi:hypothetical protein NKI56_32055 [Mesorhizobium sp. M0622]|uniref:hypothetical protein n=1 Tax=Mesorhizobium sp. M0622 TaxID=2956975 RepID=UPI003335336C